jgi:hypothetical protein
MTNANVFPTMVLQMCAIGEESGSLDHMLGKAADFYEAEVDDMVARPVQPDGAHHHRVPGHHDRRHRGDVRCTCPSSSSARCWSVNAMSPPST